MRGFAPAGGLFRRYHERDRAIAGALQGRRPNALGVGRPLAACRAHQRPDRRAARSDAIARTRGADRGVFGQAAFNLKNLHEDATLEARLAWCCFMRPSAILMERARSLPLILEVAWFSGLKHRARILQ